MYILTDWRTVVVVVVGGSYPPTNRSTNGRMQSNTIAGLLLYQSSRSHTHNLFRNPKTEVKLFTFSISVAYMHTYMFGWTSRIHIYVWRTEERTVGETWSCRQKYWDGHKVNDIMFWPASGLNDFMMSSWQSPPCVILVTLAKTLIKLLEHHRFKSYPKLGELVCPPSVHLWCTCACQFPNAIMPERTTNDDVTVKRGRKISIWGDSSLRFMYNLLFGGSPLLRAKWATSLQSRCYSSMPHHSQ